MPLSCPHVHTYSNCSKARAALSAVRSQYHMGEYGLIRSEQRCADAETQAMMPSGTSSTRHERGKRRHQLR